MRIIVIGGDAAGMSAASRIRKLLPDSEVVVYESGNFVSYSACGIPFYVGGEVGEFDDLLHYPVSKFKEERGMDVRIGSTVVSLDPLKKEIVVESKGKRYTDIYDRLVIATGASPKIPGEFRDKDMVYTIRNLDDMNRLLDETSSFGSVSVVGAGYVGLEMSEAFTARGLQVTLIQRSSQVLRGLDREFSDMVIEELRSNHVEVLLNSAVKEVSNLKNGKVNISGNGFSVDSDFIFLAVGVTPNSKLASDCGISTDRRGAIEVTRRMETSIKDIYAAGDVATTWDMVTGRSVYFPLATGSNRSGRVAGVNAAGGSIEYAGIARTEVVKVFSLNIGRTGLGENDAKEAGFDPVSATITASSRARYYPGAENLVIKLTGDRKTHRILGCIILGKEGVAKRIDVVATAIYSGLKVEDLTAVDYSYSPPFAPAWEPLGVAADVLLKKLR